VIRINKLAPDGVNLFVKAESFNPMGSVKDRMALSTIEAAEASGDLKHGQTVIEATSGNTGIGLAMVCAVKGYPLVVTMAESFSLERRKILRFLGAKVVLTPAELKGSGMLAKAVELAEAHGWFLVRQFENEANADAHTRTTAEEILAAFNGEKLDYFVTGFGTGGTLKGTSRVLRKKSPETEIVVCEPDNAQLLGSGIPQAREADGSPAGSHPNFRPHLVQGWSPDFIPKLTEDAMNAGTVDRVLPISGEKALRYTCELARKEGIFCGVSGGATFTAAMEIAETAAPGSNILCMLPDTGERYLSTPLFDDIKTEMSAEELEISRSTPNYRFDAAITGKAKPVVQDDQPVELDADAIAFVEKVTSDASQPIAFFALEWCEFCWSVRKLFAKLDIPYQALDLDSVKFQQDNLGGKIRAVLLDQVGSPTIPQIFIGGKHIGGATDLFARYSDGALADMLSEHGITMNDMPEDFEPLSLLPGWLHKR
ncbi:pyridoxal-phosphate dependent enzyme, partial [Pseudomonas sp.]|uniref:pyridoxal-phosphate dependent enzyme n=1 Tax=Pseudomonas sp. TaxID=306 RepID=UPI00299D447E